MSDSLEIYLSIMKDSEMETLGYFLKGTPWYVYLIVVYLVFVGVKSVRGGVVSIKKMFFIPIIFVWMSIDEIVVRLHFAPLYVLVGVSGLILGAILGAWQYHMLQIRVDQKKKLLEIEGSLFAAFLILVTFIVKYYVGYSFAINNHMSDEYVCTLLILSSAFTGAFVGRLFYGLYKLRVGPHVDLLTVKK